VQRSTLPERLGDLPPVERVKVLRAAAEMTRFAFQRAALVCVGADAHGDMRSTGGSGFVLRFGLRDYLMTDLAIIQKWKDWTDQGGRFAFQVGALRLKPSERLAWSDEQNGLACLRLWPGESGHSGVTQCDVTRGWPPARPKIGNYVLVSGYPAAADGADASSLDAFSTLLQITTVDIRSFECQITREHWTVEGRYRPSKDTPLAGMRGGPALLVGDLANPLVGLIAGFNESRDALLVRTLSHAPERFD
jgi:hypothetical protein